MTLDMYVSNSVHNDGSYRHYSKKLSNLASARLDSKNFQEPNSFRWIRSTAVMEAHFPRKVQATHGGFFAPGSVACNNLLS